MHLGGQFLQLIAAEYRTRAVAQREQQRGSLGKAL
ncbi:hypothetical protein SBI_09329 [Streptomyces bingchenggensis BCW-1]|uniref:Uncharacterized protein n=1 Tax=Streptomyces bingchenggensis (strain BCW-1) TaxID=749414 RepID=D7C5R8_STRBB|nr:hypothetical protein SBI_09329 [Streptomyces bingchenggensis BCW-1]